MGRYDMRPAQVLHKATMLLDTKMLTAKPPWFDAMARMPPGEKLVRPAHRFGAQPSRRAAAARGKGRPRASRMFQPLPITFPEDRLRSEFYGDHPWELARPKVVVENTGFDSRGWEWSGIEQPGKNLDGERYDPLQDMRREF
jgi:small subunit ribosomal protein S23